MRPALIIKTGSKIASLDTVPGDYESWIGDGLGTPAKVVNVAAGGTLPAPEAFSMVAITGSDAMVTDRSDWVETTAAWLRAAIGAGTPVLGICFGHQLLAHALGGTVAYNPAGVEVGTVDIRLDSAGRGDPLLGGLPARFPAQLSHRQSVQQLPPGAQVLAGSAADRHQAVAYAPGVWGLQFHPEFDAAIIRHYVNYYRQLLAQEDRDADALLAATAATPASASLLRRFAQLAGHHSEERR